MSKDFTHSISLEQTVLSDALLTKAARLKVVTELHASDFYRPEHRTLFKVLQEMTLQDRAVDLPLLVEELASRKDANTHKSELENIGGLPFLTQIANLEPTAANVGAHIAKLKALADRRNVLKELEILHAKAADLSTDDEKVTALYRAIRSMTGKPVEVKQEHMQTVRDVFLSVFGELNDQLANPDSNQNGIKTGLHDLDANIGSLKPKGLYIIGGRPANGKSALALTITINAAKAGKSVLYCGLEMSNNETVKRALARAAKVKGGGLFNPQKLTQKDWNSIVKNGDRLAKLPIVFDDSTNLSPLDVKQKAMDFQQMTGAAPNLIVLDYLGLMTAGMRKENRVQEISYITRSLKNLASELDIPIILLSQLNRDSAKENRPPRLSDLRDSGSTEQDANGVILIHRETRLSGDNKTLEYTNTATLDIAKWRNGRPAKIKVAFLPEYYTFEDYSDRQENKD